MSNYYSSIGYSRGWGQLFEEEWVTMLFYVKDEMVKKILKEEMK